jgi:hypothetical protein
VNRHDGYSEIAEQSFALLTSSGRLKQRTLPMINPGVGTYADERSGPLPEFVVGHADHRRFSNLGGGELVLDLFD